MVKAEESLAEAHRLVRKLKSFLGDAREGYARVSHSIPAVNIGRTFDRLFELARQADNHLENASKAKTKGGRKSLVKHSVDLDLHSVK